MSYCRFSSDDFRCDVYAYEHVDGGFVTHVAGNKTRGYIPRVLPLPNYQLKDAASALKRLRYGVWFRLWMWSYHLQSFYLEHAPRRALGLPHDGETFDDESAEACADRLVYLRQCGYRVPQYAIDNLRQESMEDA
jgi:hypothetical protein